jgi:hypothetical protein
MGANFLALLSFFRLTVKVVKYTLFPCQLLAFTTREVLKLRTFFINYSSNLTGGNMDEEKKRELLWQFVRGELRAEDEALLQKLFAEDPAFGRSAELCKRFLEQYQKSITEQYNSTRPSAEATEKARQAFLKAATKRGTTDE